MEKLNIIQKNILMEENVKDFVANTLFIEDQHIQDEKKKKKLTMIGLVSLYILLITVSLTLLS
ncbi:MAG: hypothetical protein IPH62_17575 [Ignavibacteriae bacterium]|nr:hypothetical protein [Ignavibacteriota bacterium]